MISGDLRRTATFGLVGLISTGIYFVIASLLAATGIDAAVASLTGHGAGSVWSYLGHRWLTFRSNEPIAETAPRFLQLTVALYGLAVAIPALFTNLLGLPPVASFAIVCVAVPLTSLTVMSRYVFKAGPADHS